jgi:hypothetical protein
MNISKQILTLLLLPYVAVLTANAAESAEAGEQQSTSAAERETVMQEAMSEFTEWREERAQSRAVTGIDWGSYNRESGWSTGLSGDTGLHRAVPDLSRGSLLGSESLISDSVRPATDSGTQSLDRPSPASSLVGEFSQIGRSGTGSGRSLFDDESAAAPGTSIRSLSSTEERESPFSNRNARTSSFGSTPWTSGAATTGAATSEAATTSPDSFTPSRPQRSRTQQDFTPDYLRN